MFWAKLWHEIAPLLRDFVKCSLVLLSLFGIKWLSSTLGLKGRLAELLLWIHEVGSVAIIAIYTFCLVVALGRLEILGLSAPASDEDENDGEGSDEP